MGEELAKRVSTGAASRAKRDSDLLEIYNAREIAILADGPEIEACIGADLGEPRK
jgi:hypothetical protein